MRLQVIIKAQNFIESRLTELQSMALQVSTLEKVVYQKLTKTLCDWQIDVKLA